MILEKMQQILTIIDYLRSIVYSTFYYSFKCGQCIIFGFKLLMDLIVILLKGLNLLLTALSDSFAVFSEDISNVFEVLAQFVLLIIQELQKISNIIFFIANSIVNIFILLHTFFNNAIQCIINLTTLCALNIKKLLVLLGSGVWFSVTLVPICMYNLCLLLINFIGEIFQETGAYILKSIKNVKLGIKDLYNFVTDVPIESIIGLIVTVSLIYIFTQFYMTIFNCIYQQLFHFLLRLRRILNHTRYIRMPTFNFNRTVRTRFPEVRRSLSTPVSQNKDSLNRSNDERCCVICQERLKCILLLPCRHVCMCSECNTRLQLYDNSCPICRNDIDDTMRVFV